MPSPFQTAWYVLRHRGPSEFVRAVWVKISGFFYAIWVLGRMKRDAPIEELLDFVIYQPGRFVCSMQKRSEFRQFLELVIKEQPATIVEVGTSRGGTLLAFCRVAPRNTHVISVDLPGGRYGGGYGASRALLYRRFANPGQRLDTVRANSHDPATLARLRQILNGKPIDLLFIDGDHTYEGVKQDFEMYSSLVRPGGLIAFHDIIRDPRQEGFDVTRFWEEIKSQYAAQEFVDSPTQHGFGIGILRME